MAVKFRNGEHHRNPSGFYNKVKYLLRKSGRDPKKLCQIFDNICYGYDNDIRYYHEIKNSWVNAYLTAQEMIKDNADNPKDYLTCDDPCIYDIKTGKLYLK